MAERTSTARRKLLMLSHCVPGASGRIDSVRAWQLLKLAQRTHDVWLAGIADASVNLSHWRHIQANTEKFTLEPLSQTRRWANSLTERLESMTRRAGANRLVQSINDWGMQNDFDAIVCTHPDFVAPASDFNTSMLLCDMHATHIHAGQIYLRGEVARLIDAVIVNHDVYRYPFRGDDRRCVMLADAIDFSSFPSPARATDTEPDHRKGKRVVLHSDWRHQTSRRFARWFSKHVWPRLRAEHHDAQLSTTETGDVTRALTDASLVVCASTDPGVAATPVLHAMAMQQPVVAAADAVNGLPIRDNEHLLMTRGEGHWTQICLEALASPTLCWHMARVGRQLVERQFDVSSQQGLLPPFDVERRMRASTRLAA